MSGHARLASYPSQRQPMPGSTAKVDPRPDHGETSCEGSGRLKTSGPSSPAATIGRAVAIAFAREGADILIAYLEESDDAKEVAALIEKEGRKAILVEGDLRSADHCRKVVDRAVQELGGVDILVNNAAHKATFAEIGDISDEEWRLTFEQRELQASDDEIREPVAASNAVAVTGLVVVGVDRIDALHPLRKRRRHCKGQCPADRLANNCDGREI